jgi:hypothetical protein
MTGELKAPSQSDSEEFRLCPKTLGSRRAHDGTIETRPKRRRGDHVASPVGVAWTWLGGNHGELGETARRCPRYAAPMR